MSQIKVSHITGFRATGANGADNAVVVQQAKAFTFMGTGLSLGDRVKFVAASASLDTDCATHSSAGSLTDGGSVGAYVGSGGVATVKALETSPKNNPWKLCYRFKDAPWRLYPALTVKSMVRRRLVGGA